MGNPDQDALSRVPYYPRGVGFHGTPLLLGLRRQCRMLVIAFQTRRTPEYRTSGGQCDGMLLPQEPGSQAMPDYGLRVVLC